MKTKFCTPWVAACMLLVAACNNAPDDAKEAAHDENKEKMKQEQLDRDIKADIKFAETAADDGLFEVQVAELAKTKSKTKEVKDFAQSMITDHSAANEELKQTAAARNISIPSSMSEDKQEKYGKLAEKNGKDFDEAYTDMMVKAHKDAIDLFEKEAENGNDPELRDWAAQKLPTLRHHLQMAEELEDKMDKRK